MVMKHKLTRVFLVACFLALGSGLFYGFLESGKTVRAVKIPWDQLVSLMRDKEVATTNIKLIRYVSVCWKDPEYPQLIVELRDTTSTKVFVKSPNLDQVTWLLKQSAEYGIDFNDEIVIPTAMCRYTSVIHLVRNGRKTTDFQSRIKQLSMHLRNRT